jgi:plasmid stability protein
MSERTTVRLPDDLVRRAKLKAAAEGRSLTALIEEGLRRVLSARPTADPTDRVLPPVSAATGGLMPGIELSDIAALRETEDLDYARRFK